MAIRAYSAHKSRTRGSVSTPQSAPMANEPQVKNNAGGYVYTVAPADKLMRFLILGSEGGTYYVSEQDLTKTNLSTIKACLATDWKRTIDMIVSVSVGGRAAKNDPAIFALAVAASSEIDEIRAYALSQVHKVCRIPTHLFHFVEFVSGFRGFGRALRRTLGEWYTSLPANKLAYEVVKYQSRDGWSNADILRLAHPVPQTEEQQAVFRWILGAESGERTIRRGAVQKTYPAVSMPVPAILSAFDALKTEKNVSRIVDTIQAHKLTREMIPTEALVHREVWEALLPSMPLTAMVRNLGTMSKVGLLTPMSQAAKTVSERLRDAAYITESRLHPMAILAALKTYESGRGFRGSNTWTVVPSVTDALNDAFYLSFGNVTPTNKRILLACDVSGSMCSLINNSMLTCHDAVAALAMVTARTEQEYFIHGFAGTFVDLGITPKMTLQDAIKKVSRMAFGSTDCAIPMQWARKQKVQADAFVVLTDNETWSGSQHPKEALKDYRDWSGIPAKQVVVGMTATDFTIADPSDPLTLDVVGFDTATPQVISEFIRS